MLQHVFGSLFLFKCVCYHFPVWQQWVIAFVSQEYYVLVTYKVIISDSILAQGCCMLIKIHVHMKEMKHCKHLKNAVIEWIPKREHIFASWQCLLSNVLGQLLYSSNSISSDFWLVLKFKVDIGSSVFFIQCRSCSEQLDPN